MKEGGIKKGMGCFTIPFALIVLPIALFLVILPFFMVKTVWLYLTEGKIANAIFALVCTCLLLCAYYGAFVLLRKFMGKGKRAKNAKPSNPNAVQLHTTRGNIVLNNPFRGIFVLGAAGSGKSESVGVPLLGQFIGKGFAGVVYDFKFPTLADDVEAFVKAKSSPLRHYYLDFNNPLRSYRVNPLNPKYIPNTSYAREYAQAIVSNLLKESIKKPDFWTRSATDLLTACIWYLKEERQDICDLPHVFAMITSNDVDLLNLLQTNTQTAQMTMSIYNAMQRKADGQVSGVIGTLQGAIAQLNTPELMYIFSGDDFSLNVNDPQNPIVLTVGSFPTLAQTFAPLLSAFAFSSAALAMISGAGNCTCFCDIINSLISLQSASTWLRSFSTSAGIGKQGVASLSYMSKSFFCRNSHAFSTHSPTGCPAFRQYIFISSSVFLGTLMVLVCILFILLENRLLYAKV